jgi:hypothetical protein
MGQFVAAFFAALFGGIPTLISEPTGAMTVSPVYRFSYNTCVVAGLFHSLKCLKMQGFRISKTSLGFNFRHQDSQKFMNFALRFIANDIDKIHLITNETALLCCKGEVPHSYSL